MMILIDRLPRCAVWVQPLLVAFLTFSAANASHAGLVRQERVATGLSAPMFTTFAPGDSTRLFIAERGGPANSSSASASIRILNLTTGALEPTPYLTITGLNNNGEGGLLGLAFHPEFQTNGRFYVNVTANDSVAGTPFSTYIREYTAPSASSNTANTTFTPIIDWTQPQSNHNGGWIGFSPNDGYLYIMSGDGGNGNDQGTGHTEPGGNAQDITSNFLGKALRIDVDRDDFTTDANRNYGIPYDTESSPGNPFAPNTPGATNPTGDDEIWAFGLRNPFRSGFDRATGDLWMGDVGQGAREEVNFQQGDSVGGENYGWRMREGLIQTPGSVGGPKPTGAIDPVYDYQRPGAMGADPDFTGTTIFGGVPYRGPDPELQGVYFFGDTSVNRLWMLRPATDTTPQEVEFISPLLLPDVGSPNSPVAITEDSNGNLYVTYLSGSVYRIVTDALTPGDFNADAKVDDADLAAWKTGFGMASGALPKDGDADNDGDVDGNDFLAWQRNFGWSALNVGAAPASNPVPEPASVVLLAAGAFAVTCATRKR